MDSVDIVDCFPGQCGQGPWTPYTMSMYLAESLDNVHGYSQSPGSPLNLDNVHGLPGQYPWAQWNVWTLSTIRMLSGV